MNTSMDTSSLKNYALPIATALVVIVLVPLVILPWLSSLRTDWDELQAKQELREQMSVKADTLESIDNSVNQDLLVNKAEPAMPSTSDPAGVLATLEQVAALSGVSTQGAQFTSADTPESNSAGGVVTVNISVSGGYSGIASFIKQTEEIARVMSLGTLHIVSGNTDGSNDQLVATFDVSAPYMPLPTDLGPVETPLPEIGPAQTALLDQVAQLDRANYAPTPIGNITGRPSPF